MLHFIITNPRGNKNKMKNELQVISGRWLNCLCFLMFGKYCPLNDIVNRSNEQYCTNCRENRQVNEVWGNRFFLPNQWLGLNTSKRGKKIQIGGDIFLYSSEILSLFYMRNIKETVWNDGEHFWYSNEEAPKHQGFYQIYKLPIPIDIIRLILQRLIYIVMKDVRIFVSFSHPTDYELNAIETASPNKVKMNVRGFGNLFKQNMLIKIK